MKRIANVLCILCALLVPVTLSGAKGKCGQNIKWELDDYGTLTISGEGRMNDYSLNSLPWRPELVKYLVIEDGITHLGKNAFSRTKITTAQIPASVKSVGENAFNSCKHLASVNLPFGIESIEKKAFANCMILNNITIPSTIRIIGDEAFANCRLLSKINIPSKLQSLGINAFKKDKALVNLTEIPEFITVANSKKYGIAQKVVKEYYDQMMINSTSLATVNLNTDKSSDSKNASVKKAETTFNYGSSDIDIDIPVRPQTNSNTFAIIIANENYTSLADVPYSINDGTSFATYCRRVLGIPESNINVYNNASYGNMIEALSYLNDIDKAYKGNEDVIFYYVGHGAPDDASKEAFLIPVDAYKPSKEVCMTLADLYSRLGNLKAKSVKVFIDACFSGATRDNNMLAQARSVAVVPKKSAVSGNTVVFSASSDSQTSWQYDDQEHGLFTYYLLKKLKDTKGDVTMGELWEYLSEQVGQKSVILNRKSQTPEVTASPSIKKVWHSWDMK